MSKITEVAELVEKGKAKLVGAAVQSALDEGCEATEILNSMIDAMAVVGERFKNGEIFVPEMLVDEARDLLRDLGIPRHLADVGVTEDKIELMAADAMKSGNIMANPRQSTIRDIIELYKKAM
mgnify:FL=1